MASSYYSARAVRVTPALVHKPLHLIPKRTIRQYRSLRDYAALSCYEPKGTQVGLDETMSEITLPEPYEIDLSGHEWLHPS